jgi:hypothetical protein
MREAIARVIGLSFFASEHRTMTTNAMAAGHVVMDGIMCASLDAPEPPRNGGGSGWLRLRMLATLAVVVGVSAGALAADSDGHGDR